MNKKFSILYLALTLSLVVWALAFWVSFPLPPENVSSAQVQSDDFFIDAIGPKAALDFYNLYKYPRKRPIPMEDLRNVTPLTPNLWSKDQILNNFAKNRNANELGIVVFVKSEHCHANAFRPCSTLTAALEKEAAKLAGKYRIYGSWVNFGWADEEFIASNPAHNTPKLREWEEKVKNEYGFEQGPGSRIVVIDPYSGEIIAASNATELNLLDEQFTQRKGQAPELDNFLKNAEAKIRTNLMDLKKDPQVLKVDCYLKNNPDQIDCFSNGVWLWTFKPGQKPFADIRPVIDEKLGGDPFVIYEWDKKKNDLKPTSQRRNRPQGKISRCNPEWFKDRMKMVDNLKDINGVPIAEIEKRARPGADAQSGFLGRDEKLKDVLKADTSAMFNLGVTNEELGEELIKIIEKEKKAGAMLREVTINHTFKGRLQHIRVKGFETKGLQFSIFANKDTGDNNNPLNRPWDTHFEISNPVNGVKILVGGDEKSGVPVYIRDIGFFEGGEKTNPWRVDPAALYSILSGRDFIKLP